MTEIEKGDALIRILHRQDPDEMPDEIWAQRVAESTFFIQTIAESLFGKAK